MFDTVIVNSWAFINTCTQYVLPEEWYPEKSCQDGEGWFDPWKRVSEATALCAEAGKGSGTQDTVRMTT